MTVIHIGYTVTQKYKTLYSCSQMQLMWTDFQFLVLSRIRIPQKKTAADFSNIHYKLMTRFSLLQLITN